jgi:hypothetical protein
MLMPVPMAKILRQLALLGVPLGPLACIATGPGECERPPPKMFDQIVSVEAPARDGGMIDKGVSSSAYGRCLQDPPDCAALCGELAEGLATWNAHVTSCERVARPGEIDQGGGRADSLEVHLAFTDTFQCIGGRRPEGLASGSCPEGGGALGRWWADLSYLEGASVPAFRRLARELTAHQAPASLVRAARRAIWDELRHQRVTAAMAARHGVRAPVARVPSRAGRPLVEVARENAVEGCVRETYGAVVAAWQARTARDPRTRAVMARIARDEGQHAVLAWAVDHWARTRLAPDQRRAIDLARRQVAQELVTTVAAADPEPSLAGPLGLPSAREAGSLARQALQSLWS